jgi:hypothetical protein
MIGAGDAHLYTAGFAIFLAVGGRVHSLPPLMSASLKWLDLLAVCPCRRGVHGEDRLAHAVALGALVPKFELSGDLAHPDRRDIRHRTISPYLFSGRARRRSRRAADHQPVR